MDLEEEEEEIAGLRKGEEMTKLFHKVNWKEAWSFGKVQCR
jgi:hypothetical protein